MSFENNILYAGAQGLLVNDFTTSSPDPARSTTISISRQRATPSRSNWQKHRYKGYAAYLTGTGNDAHSPPFADPQFDRHDEPRRAGNCRRAVNAGTNLGAAIVGLRDFVGAKRVLGGNIDIGAYEH